MTAPDTPSWEEHVAAIQMLLAQLIVAENGSSLNGAVTIPKQTLPASVYDKALVAANHLAAQPADDDVREATIQECLQITRAYRSDPMARTIEQQLRALSTKAKP